MIRATPADLMDRVRTTQPAVRVDLDGVACEANRVIRAMIGRRW
jgi:hypothetical protein